MIRKGIYIIFFLLLSKLLANAQNLSVESFRLLESDLTANTYGTLERDQNGEVAALIKIVTSETGFAFDGGMMGIVKTTQKTGEIWVYVPHSIQKITISHQQLGVLRDYYFPVSIEKARTYEMVLKTGTVRTIVEQAVTTQYVVFKVQPTNAIVFVDDDDEPRSLDDSGMLSIRLKHGHHTYRITAPSYMSESGAIEVQSEKITKEIVLQSTKATLTVNTASDAEIWINDIQRGIGKWTGELEAGEYLIESRKQSHITSKQEITLKQQERRTITISDPVPIYGTLDVQSTPLESDVYVDGKLIGQTPLLVEKFLVGEHTIRLQKKGYNIVEQKITIDEGSQLSHKYTLTAQAGGTESNSIVGIESTKSPIKPAKIIDLDRKRLSKTNVYAGANYQMLHTPGIEAFVGAYLSGFNLECGYLMPKVPSSKVYWKNNTTYLSGEKLEYDYNFTSAITAHLGYGIMLSNSLRVTPRVGLLFNQLSGKYCGTEEGLDEQTFVVSGRVGLRTEYSPIRHMGFVLTPAYDMPVVLGTLAKQVDGNTSIVKDWCSGFSIIVGIELYF